MSQETDGPLVNHVERSRAVLLAHCRETLTQNTRLAVAELAKHLPPENQAELRMPPQEDISRIQVVVTSPDKKSFYRITYFIKPHRYPLKAYFEVQPRNKIVIEKGKSWFPGQKNFPSTDSWGPWHGMSTKYSALWERGKDGSRHRFREYDLDPDQTAAYQNNLLVEGEPTLLKQAVEALENAFQTTGPKIKTLNYIKRITWGTETEPEKPEPPSGGGRRVPRAQRELVPIRISIPL